MARHYEDSDTRRRQVAEAALCVIAEDGVARFTTKALAKRVGISDGALFRHFGSKQEIVLEAMGLLEAEMERGLLSTGNSLVDLEGFFRHRAAFVGAEASVGRLVFSAELIPLAGEDARKCIVGWRARSVEYLIERLMALQKAGTFRNDLDVPAMSMLVQGVLLTFAMQATIGNTDSKVALQSRIDKAWASLLIVLLS